jgi:hypothetical protein
MIKLDLLLNAFGIGSEGFTADVPELKADVGNYVGMVMSKGVDAIEARELLKEMREKYVEKITSVPAKTFFELFHHVAKLTTMYEKEKTVEAQKAAIMTELELSVQNAK